GCLTVAAVKAAFAAKGVALVVAPVGGDAAEAVELEPHGSCPIFIVFRLRGTSGLGRRSRFCSSRGAIGRDSLSISYMPASIGVTIEKALAKVSDGAVAPMGAAP